MIKFEWDTAKATSNKKKHGVSFEEAQSVFYDEFAVQFFDDDNSVSEADSWCLVSAMKLAYWLSVIANVIKATLFESSRQEKPRKTRVTIIKGLDHENWIRLVKNEISQKSLCGQPQKICHDAVERRRYWLFQTNGWRKRCPVSESDKSLSTRLCIKP